jgi:hypothetical protein
MIVKGGNCCSCEDGMVLEKESYAGSDISCCIFYSEP